LPLAGNVKSLPGIAGLGDVNTTGAQENDILSYQSGKWQDTSSPIFTTISVKSDQKINLEGSAGDSYFIYNSANASVDLYVGGSLIHQWK